ncbi:head GIN domain-containing protein [Massilia sp. DWR3-1-1]|uniref:head GIN domain-containing protein n=1 Tax=Massilia sp. DWR3-1-1 TaxID=2804559 RepID=UPI003CEFD9A5
MPLRPAPRRRFAMLIALGVIAVSVPTAPALARPWNSNDVAGTGRIKTDTRSLAAFHGVSMSLPGSVEIRLGNTESVTIETDDNLLPLIETVVENGTLKIRSSKRNLGLNSRHLKLVVQARTVDQLALGGSGSIDAAVLKGANLAVHLGGSGTIKVRNIDTDALTIDLGGSGELQVAEGRAGRLTLSIAGSGNADLGRLQALSASVNIAGSGDATVVVRDRLDVAIVGSGDVNYYGDPTVNRSVMGSGSATRQGPRR